MALLKQLRGFIRAFRRNAGPPPVKHAGHSFASAVKDVSHLAAGGKGGNATVGRGQNRVLNMVAEGHEDYNKSLQDDD